MMSRLWIIPMIMILTINLGLTIINPILPDDMKLTNYSASDVIDMYFYNPEDQNFSNEIIQNNTDISSTVERESNNLPVSPGQMLSSASKIQRYIELMLFGVIILGVAIGFPKFIVAIISIPVMFIYFFALLYLFSNILSVFAGIFR